jgi:hypothetical protein
MGTEILYPLAWFISAISIVGLALRARTPAHRPYALSTLVLSFVLALLWAWASHKPGYYFGYVFTWFAPVVIVLGVHAHAIRWLVDRRSAVDAP